MTEPNAAAKTSPRPGPRYFRFGPQVLLALGACVLLIDQLIKLWAVAQLQDRAPVHLLGETVRLVLLRNPGAAFSLGTAFTPVIGVLATAVVVGIIWYSRRVHSRWWAVGLGLVLGGAAGNLTDRLVRSPGVLRGHVVDYLSVGWWPVFNVADAFLVTGVIVIAVAVLMGEDQLGWRDRDRAAMADSATEKANG